MNTQTSLVAEQIRLQQWADQIRDCQNRPSDMKVDAWCREHGITKANYYYRLCYAVFPAPGIDFHIRGTILAVPDLVGPLL